VDRSGGRQSLRLGGSAVGRGWRSVVRRVILNFNCAQSNLSRWLTGPMRNSHSLWDMNLDLEIG
jgi:hypothetical protein